MCLHQLTFSQLVPLMGEMNGKTKSQTASLRNCPLVLYWKVFRIIAFLTAGSSWSYASSISVPWVILNNVSSQPSLQVYTIICFSSSKTLILMHLLRWLRAIFSPMWISEQECRTCRLNDFGKSGIFSPTQCQ